MQDVKPSRQRRWRLLGSLAAILTAAAPASGADKPMGTDPPTAAPLRIPVRLHAGPTVTAARATPVAFGVPFQRGVLTDIDELRVVDGNGRELPSDQSELARWRLLGRESKLESVRAALVRIEVVLEPGTVQHIYLETARRSARLNPAAQARATWVSVRDGVDRNEYGSAVELAEPAVYATLEPEWLGSSFLRSTMRAVGVDREWRWYDEAQIGYAKTAVNDVPDQVAADQRIDYLASAEPWQLDRASSLWNVYVRTGDVKWLRHAHRATQFYARHIGANGAFALKTSSPDLKYSYGLPLLIDYLLTGDDELLRPIENIARFASTFTTTYRRDLTFWTERHQAYALLAALTAWEATGKPVHAARTVDVANATFRAAREPAADWPVDGCVLHTIRQHEGDDDARPACSPWMSALLGEAVWRYYLFSEDRAALEFLANLGEFLVEYGVRDVSDAHPQLRGRWAPWYLASRSVQYTDSGPWADIEHQCDVAGLVARGVWAAGQLGRDQTSMLELLDKLIDGCRRNLEAWHRPADASRPAWRLQPPRKFNWWFGTTSDLSAIVESLAADRIVTPGR